jgi:hypothetical protein
MLKDPEVYKPLTLAIFAFATSLTIEGMDQIAGVVLIFGRLLTGAAMVAGGGVALIKMFKNKKDEQRKD